MAIYPGQLYYIQTDKPHAGSVFDFFHIHGKGAIQEMRPFAERNNNEGPLSQDNQVYKVYPAVVVEQPGVDGKPHGKGRESHEQKPDYEKPVRRL